MQDWRSYDGVATTYERVHAFRFAEVAKDLFELCGLTAGQRLLDVGTGTGAALELADGAWPVGIDASPAMVAHGHAARPKIRLIAAEAVDLPFRAGTFDVVTANFVLAHFTKAETALHDMLRVLKPGGKLAVSSWSDGRDTFADTWRELVETIVPRTMLDPTYDRAVPGHGRFAKRNQLEELFLEAGLRKVRSDPRRYRWAYGVDEYVDGLAVFATGRFVRQMLGEDAWAGFLDRAKATFRERFADPLNDYRDVLVCVGTKG
ncbi:MAG: methyltransferase domain-containing protein [Actinomycetota bacterium]